MKSKVVMWCHPYVTSSHKIDTAENTGEESNICSINFGTDGERCILTLQNRGKWNKQKRNCKVGDVVLLKEDAECNQWPVAKIVAVNSDAKGDVYSVKY